MHDQLIKTIPPRGYEAFIAVGNPRQLEPGSAGQDGGIMEIVKSDTPIDVPPEIATCPYCGGKLYVQCEAWTQEDDGSWTAQDIVVDCETEPDDLGSKEYRDWVKSHSEMPYVYQMPVEEGIREWLNSTYRFDLSTEGNLKAWNEAVRDWQ